MNICLDIRTLCKKKSGVENHVHSIVSNLIKVDNENSYILLKKNSSISGFEELVEKDSRVNFLQTNFSNENHPAGDIWEHFYLPGILKKLNVDIFHGPNYLIPFRKKGFATVSTVHDLVAFLFPETVPMKYSVYMKFIIKKVVDSSDKIIAVSNSTKSDLINMFKISEDRISVVYNGVSKRFFPRDKEAQDKIKEKHNLPDNFILHVGNLEPRKNFLGIVEAFRGLVEQKKRKGLKLVLAGKEGWLHKDILKKIKEKNISDSIVFPGYVDSNDLPALYSAAKIFIFPSFHEGFGIPVLEAMACGTPVVTSNVSSLPEVAGDSAMLVNPANNEEITNSLARLLEEDSLRTELANKGLERAKQFSWENSALKLLKIYGETDSSKEAL